MTLVEQHTEVGLSFIRQAEAHFQNGDMPKASKSAWDAVEFCLKAIAKQRGWDHESHLDLSRVVSRLAKESEYPRQIHMSFGSVDGLLYNAYEDWFTDDIVESGIQDAKGFVDVLEKFIDAGTSEKTVGKTSPDYPEVHTAR